MEIDHAFTLWLSKFFWLFYLIAMSVAVTVYACWPRNKARFDKAATSVLCKEDRPWR
jgi:cytochrome c oxidase cbb3-type subunit 4